MRNLLRKPLPWMVLAECAVVAALLLVAWHLIANPPVPGSNDPMPTTRVGRRAPPPSTLRANPVVNSFTVEAGMSGASGFTLHSIWPD